MVSWDCCVMAEGEGLSVEVVDKAISTNGDPDTPTRARGVRTIDPTRVIEYSADHRDEEVGACALYLEQTQQRTITSSEDLSLITASSVTAVQLQEESESDDGILTTVPVAGEADDGPAREESNHVVRGDLEDELCSVSVEEQQTFLRQINDELSSCFPDLVFTLSHVHDSADKLIPVLLITQRQLFNHAPFGAVSRVRIAVHYRSYTVHVLMREWKHSRFESVAEIRELCLLFDEKSEFRFCPGIDPEHYKEYFDVFHFHVKSARLQDFPFRRIDSVNCKMFFKLAHNARKMDRDAREVKCSACKRLITDIKWQKERTSKETPTRKTKRQRPSSRARLSYMSPASQAKRKKLAQYERTNNIRKLQKYEESEVILDDDQNSEMCQIMEKVTTEDLEKLYKEGDEHGVRKVMQDIWVTDKERQRIEFACDQATNSNGGRGNRWNIITIRMALAIYIRSPSAYEALKQFNILKLPAKSTLQSYTGTFIHEPGASTTCIAEQVTRYLVYKEECRQLGKQEPKADGAIIFDEVKVACQLVWNSRNHQLVGLAMTPKDLASLNDIYELLKSPSANKQTSYILQFIWRDLTSKFDIVGPYFTSPSTVDCQFVVACVFETIELFQLFGLKTSVLVCDGGSANVAAIKASHDHHGAYSVTEGLEDKYEVTPWMINPYNPPHKIFWLICPSHQLKNMINALFSSKSNGTKQFRRGDKCTFGWQTIMDLYQRELARVGQNCTRMVPRLKEAYCLRDAWTKLNVHPAKIMQQEQVLGELHWYTHQDPLPNDVSTAKETLLYLEACNLLFEQGFLSHDQVRSADAKVLMNIDKGFSYFTDWLDSLLKIDPNFPHTTATQKSFLSWQTWDLLRIDVYSFRALCQWFRETYPTYFISPLRLSGSAVESLFSQYKHNAGGKLDSANFSTARAAHLVKQCVTDHHSGKGYRDDTLSTIEIPLTKKKYNKKDSHKDN